MSPTIIDPLSYPGRIIRSVQAEFALGVDIPLPEETVGSLNWLSATPPEVVTKFWEDQLGKPKQRAVSPKGHQRVRGESIPETLRKAGWNIHAISLHQLMPHFGLGGNKWARRLVSGLPTTGVVSQVGVFPHSDKAKPPISTQMIWKSSSKRFQERAARASFGNAFPLWGRRFRRSS